jgi:hypothetical protein
MTCVTTRLADTQPKVKKIRQAYEEDNCSDSESYEEQLLTTRISRAPFSCGYEVGAGKTLQTLPSQMPFIWQIFIENIDPFIKVLHIPTMTKVMQDSNGKFDKKAERSSPSSILSPFLFEI